MTEEIKKILEEISNDENYSNFIDSQNGGAEYYLLLEKIEGKQLLNYITNLQKENEQLRTEQNTYINTIKEVNKECNSLFNHLTKKDLDYKSRNEKAIEYIKSHNPSDIGICGNNKKYYYTLNEDSVDNLLNILEGGDE